MSLDESDWERMYGKTPTVYTDEQQELLNSYQKELEKCSEIAQRLDFLNPDLVGSFIGTPSERIERQLHTLGIL